MKGCAEACGRGGGWVGATAGAAWATGAAGGIKETVCVVLFPQRQETLATIGVHNGRTRVWARVEARDMGRGGCRESGMDTTHPQEGVVWHGVAVLGMRMRERGATQGSGNAHAAAMDADDDVCCVCIARAGASGGAGGVTFVGAAAPPPPPLFHTAACE